LGPITHELVRVVEADAKSRRSLSEGGPHREEDEPLPRLQLYTAVLLLTGFGLIGTACDGNTTLSPTSTDRADTAQAGVEVVPTGRKLQAECRIAANLLGFAVPCPTRFPRTRKPVECHTPSRGSKYGTGSACSSACMNWRVTSPLRRDVRRRALAEGRRRGEPS
jgi:hypothetical protein